MPHIAVIMLSIISFISTYSGMQSLMTNIGDNGLGIFGFMPSEIINLISFLFTFTVQIMIIYHAMHIKGAGWSIFHLHRNLVMKSWHITVYITFTLLSVGFSYAFWFERIGADTYSKDIYREEVYKSLQRLDEFRNAYTNFSNITSNLASYSQQKAREERQVGGTCGGAAKVGAGPRMRLRAEDAIYFSAQQRYFDQQTREIDQLINKLNHDLQFNMTKIEGSFTSQQIEKMQLQLNRANLKANILRQSSIRTAFISWLGQRIDTGKNGIPDGHGKLFTCPDRTIETMRNELLKVEFPALSENIKLFNPNDSKQSVFLAFKRISEFVTSIFERLWNGTENNIILKLAEIIPLVGGILIDFMIFIVAPPEGTSNILNRRKSFLSSVNHAFSDKPLLHENVWRELKKNLNLIRRYEFRYGKRHYLIYPTHSRQEEHLMLGEMIDLLLDNHGIKLLSGRIKSQEIEHQWINNHPDLSELEVFSIYEMRPKIRQELIIEKWLWSKKKSDPTPTTMDILQALHRAVLDNIYDYLLSKVKHRQEKTMARLDI
jgi:hypothetical protein